MRGIERLLALYMQGMYRYLAITVVYTLLVFILYYCGYAARLTAV